MSQRKLWRDTAIIGFVTGVCAVLSLIFDIRLGFNQAYFGDAYNGTVPALVQPESYADYAILALAVPFVFILRLFLSTLFMMLLREAIIPPNFRMLTLIHQMAIMGMAAIALVIAMGYVQVLFYASDADRHLFVLLIRNGNLIYSLMVQLAQITILLAAFQNRMIPRSVLMVSALILLMAFVYSMIAVNPKLTQFFSVFIAYISALIVAVYMGIASQAKNGQGKM